jgi:hypothetical protein
MAVFVEDHVWEMFTSICTQEKEKWEYAFIAIVWIC